MDKIEVNLFLSRETKGSVLYLNNTPGEAVQNIYIKKHAFAGQDFPLKITVTVTAAPPKP